MRHGFMGNQPDYIHIMPPRRHNCTHQALINTLADMEPFPKDPNSPRKVLFTYCRPQSRYSSHTGIPRVWVTPPSLLRGARSAWSENPTSSTSALWSWQAPRVCEPRDGLGGSRYLEDYMTLARVYGLCTVLGL